MNTICILSENDFVGSHEILHTIFNYRQMVIQCNELHPMAVHCSIHTPRSFQLYVHSME
ncbi:hypothetical protein BDB01DRAFT_769126 [Pilobolus umbonatus]|nr:hypothetical protein BDB01DRAFT_769126 [Pilobolus umbonatus]